MAENNAQGGGVGTEVPFSLFVGGVAIALVLIALVAIVNVG
ncbi:hypothetical protein FHS82_000090 [Pseudochelatococcus lubricantis]|uniref:Uncharacterized protein n=1 Tax=Pseudochelatococcus lubricantis TaxID=1538102 RepID=A0ABX0UU28_9HYPH|nr:hypothetical protein [Pseudochelatococcus lubricantis]NIJ56277.1 hypothetical protein [Pseudochelatococcus lubricantis]